MMTDGDPDQDLLIEYTPHEQGIRNQVWKDSGDSTFNEDGQDAEGHIAVVEVQGYAYAAYLAGAQLARVVGDSDSRPVLHRTRPAIAREAFSRASGGPSAATTRTPWTATNAR